VHGYPAHTAPLGLHFIRSQDLPAEYRGAALAALHGSWNRTQKDGYKVVSIHWLPDGSIEQRDFVAGFEIDDDVIGRPVDIAEGPDGAFYVSDDYSGQIYRVAYVGTAGARSANPQ
jgi:glucose/arabinose dehydrogenase